MFGGNVLGRTRRMFPTCIVHPHIPVVLTASDTEEPKARHLDRGQTVLFRHMLWPVHKVLLRYCVHRQLQDPVVFQMEPGSNWGVTGKDSDGHVRCEHHSRLCRAGE